MARYNGHKNWNHWNVSLWLFNDEALYRLVMRHVRPSQNSLDVAAALILEELPPETPDRAPYTFSSVRAALRGL